MTTEWEGATAPARGAATATSLSLLFLTPHHSTREGEDLKHQWSHQGRKDSELYVSSSMQQSLSAHIEPPTDNDNGLQRHPHKPCRTAEW